VHLPFIVWRPFHQADDRFSKRRGRFVKKIKTKPGGAAKLSEKPIILSILPFSRKFRIFFNYTHSADFQEGK